MCRNNPPEFLGRTRNTPSYITAPRSGASAFKPSIEAISFLCLAVGRVAAIERGASTAGYVKLLLPPRQSRRNSYFGLVRALPFSSPKPIWCKVGW